MSDELSFMRGDLPKIRFSVDAGPNEIEITRWPRFEITLPVSWRIAPADGLRFLASQVGRDGVISAYAQGNGVAYVAGALLLACNVTLRQLEEEGGVAWSGLFASGTPWLKRLATRYGDDIAAGNARTTLTDLLTSDNAEIRAFAIMRLEAVPERPA